MKTWQNIFYGLLLIILVPACSPDSTTQPDANSSANLISIEQTREVGMHVLLNRYPKATIVSEKNEREVCIYRFSTNGTIAPFVLIVDRKTSKGRFEKSSH